MSWVPTPRLVVDPAWERSILGPTVERARSALRLQLERGVADTDPRPTLARAYASVPFYQSSFARLALGARDLEDPRALAMIPPTRRSDLACGVEPFLSMPVERFALERGWLGRTSGSTGEPVEYLRDPRTHAWFWAFLDFALAYAEVPNAAPRRAVVLLDALDHMPEYDARLPLFHDATFAKRSASRPDLAAALEALEPVVITGDPESLAPLARLDLPPRARPSLVLSSAFTMPASLRDAIAAATGAAVLEYYATQETSVIAIGCRAGRGFHPLSGACHVESIAGELGPELVVTPLHNPSFVLVRYAPGDLGAVVDDATPCACGLAGPRIASLDGRTAIAFDGACGPFAAGLLGPLLARLPVLEHQLVQRASSRYELRYRAAAALARDRVAAVEGRLAELSGAPIDLELVQLDGPLPRSGAKPAPYRVEGS